MTDASIMPLGIVEGYYGRTWAHDDRRGAIAAASTMGLNAFLYCPKSDEYLRRQWQDDWPAEQWLELQLTADHCAALQVQFGVGLSPYALYTAYGQSQRRALKRKIERLNALEAPLLAVLFDDMPGDVPDLAHRQADIIADIRQWTTAQTVLMCPTYYSDDPVLETHFGAMPGGYLEALGESIAPEVDIFWIGRKVCSERIALSDLGQINQQLKRPVTLWDNYPVNDGAVRSKHMYFKPLPDRDPKLSGSIRGHYCNPMNQAYASLPALSGLAALHRGESVQAQLEQALGGPLLDLIERDAGCFEEQGLNAIAPDEAEALAGEYQQLATAAAQEIAGWLRGEYTFDPACLTD